jgi:hypothetical protein
MRNINGSYSTEILSNTFGKQNRIRLGYAWRRVYRSECRAGALREF